METRLCNCGCGSELPESNTNGFKWGHKGKKELPPPPSKSLAKREAEITIDAEPKAAEEYVLCQISTSQLDTIYSLLGPHQKAMAVLNALNESA